MKLTHLDDHGNALMVSVSDKEITKRTAVATAKVRMKKDTWALISSGESKKGDVLAVARVAGISGAKETSRLIPLCHNIVLDKVRVTFSDEPSDTCHYLTVSCEAVASGRTGVEMEALTGASIAALTIYDMCKAVDRQMTVEETRLEFKDGGKSGLFQR